MRRRTLSRDESTPLLTMEQTPPTKEKLDVQSDDAVVIDGELSSYSDRTFVGADPVVKRAVADVTHEGRQLRLCKGLVAKLLDAHGDGGVEFDVECDREAVRKADAELASRGFKTLGVVGGPRNGPLKFAGILPMLDPPGHEGEC